MNTGSRIRFLQARYNLECIFLHRYSKAAEPILDEITRGALEAACKAIPECDPAKLDYFCDTLSHVPNFIDVKKLFDRAGSKQLDQFIVRESQNINAYRDFGSDDEEIWSLIHLDNLAQQMGLSSRSRMGQKFSRLKELTPEILGHLTQGGVFGLTFPTHQMILQSDPENGVYRFFDPNLGVMRTGNPKFLVRHIIHFLDTVYGHGLEGKSGQTHEFRGHLEVPIRQAMGDHGLCLGDGVCAAMSFHVAKFFLTHHLNKDMISAEMLGLEEFSDPRLNWRSKAYSRDATKDLKPKNAFWVSLCELRLL